MARSAKCECTSRFTCRDCFDNRKPYFFTCDDGTRIYKDHSGAGRGTGGTAMVAMNEAKEKEAQQ